jgi:predicted RNase H-like nuclease (RuvC/YqgF family)
VDAGTITGILVAAGGFLGVIVTVVIFRTTKHEADIEKIKKEAIDSSSLTLEGWTRLNKALQDEVDRLQRRVNQMETAMDNDRKAHDAEIAELRRRLAATEGDPYHA